MDESIKIMCDGVTNDQLIAHPRVYLRIEPNKVVMCPYCGKEFSYESSDD